MNDINFTHVGSPVGEPLHYTACGLDNIYLSSGYRVREVGGERYVSVKEADDLHKAIALFLCRHRKVLDGKEVRFLRKQLDLTQKELGVCLGVSDQSIARYEKGLTTLEGAADSMLRLLVAGQLIGCINVRDELEHFKESDDCTSATLTLERGDHEWRVAA